MKPAERRPESGMRDRWMVSYMDVLTILLIFFVAVAAKSLTPPPKKAPMPPPPTPVIVSQPVVRPPALEEVREKIIEHGMDPRLDLKMDSRGLMISLPQTMFRPGKDKVEAAALPVVDGIAQVLERIPNKISVIGHADPVPIHNRRFRNNWELAAARGLRVLELLTTRGGIPEARVSTASYGSTEPRNSNDTPGGRAGNRRVEILVMASEP